MNKLDVIVLGLAGHGGLNAGGVYPRFDKQSPQVPPGIYEGAWNREVTAEMVEELTEHGIAAQNVNPGPINQRKKSVIGYINDTVRRTETPICLFEIHANSTEVKHYDERGWYDENGEDNETGYTIFITKNASKKSEELAHTLDKELQANGYPIPSRGVKRANFSIIKGTSCPAVLFEAGFMSSKSDVKLLQEPLTIKKLNVSVVNTVTAVYSAGQDK